MNKKAGLGKFIIGAAIGAGLGVLFAPKKGSELRKDLKEKIDDLVAQIKKIDIEEVKAEFDLKVEEIKNELADLDKEKALSIAKEKGNQLKEKAEELVALAKKKGTPVLIDSAQDVLENVVKVSKDAIKKLEAKKDAE
jgi:gas vesicle protein